MARKAAAQVAEGAKPPEAAPVLTDDIEIEVQDVDELLNEGRTEGPVSVETAPEKSEPAPIVSPEPPPPPPEDHEKEAMRRRVAELEQAERQTRQTAAQWQNRAYQSYMGQVQAQLDSVINAIGSAQAGLDEATLAVETAGNAGDWRAMAEAQSRIGRYGGALQTLEQQKSQLETHIEQQKARAQQAAQQQLRQQPPQSQGDLVEAAIVQAAIPQRAKEWLRNHREFLTSKEKNDAMQKAHDIASKEVGEWSLAYYDRMEELLGFRGAQKQQQSQQPANHQSQSRQAAPVSAPPSRESISMATGRAAQPTKVTLNAQEREVAATIAESRKISQAEAEREYARQKIKWQQQKALDGNGR